PRGGDDRGTRDGAPDNRAGRDRLPGLRRRRGATRGASPLRLGRRARDRSAGTSRDHSGALSLLEPEARERRCEGPGDARRRLPRGHRRGRRPVQQRARCLRRNAPRRPDPEAAPGCRRAPRRPGARARDAGRRPRRAAPPGEARVMLGGMLLVLALAMQRPADSGAALFASWCKSCHGADGRGTPAASTRLEVPPADLHECKGSTAETEDRWVKIVAQGGAAFGLSLDMPAFGEAGTPAQIRAVVRYARSLCGELGWPPGELNFPRAFLVEKAYPEDEVVITDEARGQEYIYEHRLGKRCQLEAS